MSLRKSLYKQYNRNTLSTSSSFISLAGTDTEDKHWVRTWYDPPVPSSLEPPVAGQAVGTPGSGINGSLGGGRHPTPNQSSVVSTAQASVINSHESTPQPGSVNGSENVNNGLEGSGSPLFKTYGFKIKTWVIADGPSEFKDCEDEEKDAIIDLDNFKYGINEYAPKVEISSEQNEQGLTEADIKSAVGGTGVGSSLFSSSAAQEIKEKKEQEEKPAPSAEPTPAPAVEAAAPVVEEKKDDTDATTVEQKNNADVDVEMKE